MASDAIRRSWLLRCLSLAPLVAGALAWWLSPAFRELMRRGMSLLIAQDEAGLRELGAELGLAAALFTSLLMVVQALAAPIPAVLVTATNSYLFGPFAGAWISITAATVAALLCFALARAWGEPVVARLVPAEKLARANRFLERNGALAVLGARLIPLVPFDPISYVAGLSRMRAWTFTWATFVGQIPAGLAYSYLAQETDSPARLAVLIPLTLIGLSLFAWVARRALATRGQGGTTRA